MVIESSSNARYLPLSSSQQNIYHIEQIHPGLPTNNICGTLVIKGQVQIPLMIKSVAILLETTPALHYRVTEKDGEPVQYLSEISAAPAPFYDFTLTRQDGLKNWESSMATSPMPFFDSPLFFCAVFKTAPDEGGFLIKTHHLVSDAWSHMLLADRIAKIYIQQISGNMDHLPQFPDYAIHIAQERTYLESSEYQKDRQYWYKQLAELPNAPLREKNAAERSPVGQRLSFSLSDRINFLVADFCEKRKVSPFAVFLLAFSMYINRTRGLEKFCIGVPVINRRNVDEKQSVGMFVNTLPFISEVNGLDTLDTLNERLQNDWYSLLKHQRVPYQDIAAIARENNHEGALFDVVISYQNGHMQSYADTDIRLAGRWHYSGYQMESLCIHASNREDEANFLLDYDFLTQVFSVGEIEQMHEESMRLLLDALQHPDKQIHELSLLSPQMEETVLYTFNRTKPIAYANKDVASALSASAKDYPRRVSVISGGTRLTYEYLYVNALEMATRIASLYPGGQNIIALLYPRDISLFTAFCAVSLSGNAFLLLDETMPPARIAEYIRQSNASMLLGNEDLIRNLGYTAVRVLTTSQLLQLQPGPLPAASQDHLAYLVFTSGSTGRPKAVAVTQRNLLCFASAMRPLYAEGAVLSLCSVSFDAFIIESLSALINAQTVVLASEDERNEPVRLASLIRDYAVGFFAITPSRITAYMQNPSFRQALSRVESIVCGGEAFPPQLFSLLRNSTNARIYNQYGPSEATVGVTYKLICEDTKITAGSPMPGSRIYILDAYSQPLPIGSIGEIYIGGSSVAQGYFGDAALTQKWFRPDPFSLKGRMYRTGDQGEWTSDGELKLYGRVDEQLKINGTRFEPEEIAACLTTHPGVKDAAVRLITVDNRKVLTAYYTDNQAPEPDELLAFAAMYLPRAVVPLYAIRLETLPVTGNGKLDILRLPVPQRQVTAEDAADEIEKSLLSMWRTNLKNNNIWVNSDYYASGGDSLSAISLLQEIAKDFRYEVSLSVLNSNSTVRKLANYLRGGAIKKTISIEFPLAPVQSSYPLTKQQESFLLLHQIEPNSLAYNMPGAFAFSTPVNTERLQSAFEQLIQKDDCFRTGFRLSSSGGEQFVIGRSEFKIAHLSAKDLNDAVKQFIQPFDLSKPPLLRAALWENENHQQILLVDIHHIISDGISSGLMIRRLDQLYRGNDFEMPHVRMSDIAYHASRLQGDLLESQKRFWKQELDRAPSFLSFPTDFPYPTAFNYKGAKIRGSLPLQLASMANDYCTQENTTPFCLFAAVFTALIYRLCAQEDIIIGTPVSLRTCPELNDVSGALISTFPLRCKITKDMHFSEHVKNTNEQITKILDNRLVSFDEIVSLSGVERDSARNPLCNIIFSYLPIDATEFMIGDSKLTNLPLDSGTAKFDFSLEIAPGCNGYSYTWEYAVSLFEKGTIEMLSRAFPAALQSVLTAKDIIINDISACAPSDLNRLVHKPHHSYTPYEQTFIDEMIDRQALFNPTAVAVSWGDNEQYTYMEVSKRSDALASYLLQNGIAPGSCVGLLSRRTGDMPVALLGILKAGCAYVPLDYAYPSDRMVYMLAEADAQALLLTDSISAPEGCPCRVIPLRFSSGKPYEKPKSRRMTDAFFVLYTSGTTGRPKGVRVLHKGISNLLCDVAPMLDIDNCRVLCAANVIFDIYTIESMMAWSQGKQIIMCDENEMLLANKMAERMIRGEANVLQLTPSRMQMCLADKDFRDALGRIKLVILAGEPFTTQLLDSIRSLTEARIINIYGPTETTVFSSYADLTKASVVTIGKPVANSRFYALDDTGRMVPPLATGEVYIAGECVGGGYIGRDDLTRVQFFPDPFFPGDTMYKTGDIARLRHDGNWMLYGRRDHQIKMNGHRIEPDEICMQILKSGHAHEAVVIPEIVNHEVRAIRAFVVPAPQFDETGLRGFLAQQLPAYMVPATFTRLKALPRTASGKTDRFSLAAFLKDGVSSPEVTNLLMEAPGDFVSDNDKTGKQAALVSVNTTKEESTSEKPGLQEIITNIWKTELASEIKNINVSFFEMGGSSLTALKVLTAYYNLGYQMSYPEFTRDPTIKGHTAFFKPSHIGLQQNDETAVSPVELPQEIPVLSSCIETNPFEQQESEKPTSVPQKREDLLPTIQQTGKTQPVSLPRRLSPLVVPAVLERDILLTGASGYLGAHILKEALEKGYFVRCLLRQKKRLIEALEFYYGTAEFALDNPRFSVIHGDITLPRFGLAENEYIALAEHTGIVIHTAADVRHFAPENELLLANVTGTQNILYFAELSRSRLLHMSTASVCGDHLLKAPGLSVVFTEKDLDIGQNWQDNTYVKSKILAEADVSQAVRRGLSAHIFRVGRLVARAKDGRFQRNPSTNFFFRMIKGMAELNAVPESMSHAEMELTPVDSCAKAIMALMGDNRCCSHIINPNKLCLKDIVSYITKVEILPDADFRSLVRSSCIPGVSTYIQSLAEMALGGQYTLPKIRLDSSETERALATHGFQWTKPGKAALQSMFRDGGTA